MKIYSRIKRFILTPMIKFHRFRMRKRRIKSADLKMKWPEEILDETIENWKGNLEQVDDVLVIGIRI